MHQILKVTLEIHDSFISPATEKWPTKDKINFHTITLPLWYLFFLSLAPAKLRFGGCYWQNPRIEARLKNGLGFLLNTTVAHLGLTLVVSFQTQGLGPGFRSALSLEQGAWTGAGGGEGWVLFSAADSLQRDRRMSILGRDICCLIQNSKGGTQFH